MAGPLSLIVHNLDHVRTALRAAQAAGVSAALYSAAGASRYLGGGYWAALETAARADFPNAEFELILDCGDRAGEAMAALDAGCRSVRYTGPPETKAKLADIAGQLGSRIVDTALPRSDLNRAEDPDAYCRELLTRR